MYEDLINEIEALTLDNEYDITILSNTSSSIYNKLNNLNWVGFYRLIDDNLYLSSFMGKPACIKIPVGKGVCGTCIKENKTIVVDNVHKFEGHIACDSASNSEICIPIYKNNILYGLLDIDSPIINRFNNIDKDNLEKIATIISTALGKTRYI